VSDKIIDIPAGEWYYPTSNPAPLDTDSGTNDTIKRHLFDDTTEEFVVHQIRIPNAFDTSGTVTLQAWGYASTAQAASTAGEGGSIELKFYHAAVAEGESWDAAFSNVRSGYHYCQATQDYLDEVEWTETVSNLGWAEGDLVRIKLSRITIAGEDALSGDWGLVHFRIRIPRST
jgi:hypothetical protein